MSALQAIRRERQPPALAVSDIVCAVLVLALLLSLPVAWWAGARMHLLGTRSIQSEAFRPMQGGGWRVKIVPPLSPEELAIVMVHEDGVPLQHVALRRDFDVRQAHGTFWAKNNALILYAGDGNDPRSNGRTYVMSRGWRPKIWQWGAYGILCSLVLAGLVFSARCRHVLARLVFLTILPLSYCWRFFLTGTVACSARFRSLLHSKVFLVSLFAYGTVIVLSWATRDHAMWFDADSVTFVCDPLYWENFGLQKLGTYRSSLYPLVFGAVFHGFGMEWVRFAMYAASVAGCLALARATGLMLRASGVAGALAEGFAWLAFLFFLQSPFVVKYEPMVRPESLAISASGVLVYFLARAVLSMNQRAWMFWSVATAFWTSMIFILKPNWTGGVFAAVVAACLMLAARRIKWTQLFIPIAATGVFLVAFQRIDKDLHAPERISEGLHDQTSFRNTTLLLWHLPVIAPTLEQAVGSGLPEQEEALVKEWLGAYKRDLEVSAASGCGVYTSLGFDPDRIMYDNPGNGANPIQKLPVAASLGRNETSRLMMKWFLKGILDNPQGCLEKTFGQMWIGLSVPGWIPALIPADVTRWDENVRFQRFSEGCAGMPAGRLDSLVVGDGGARNLAFRKIGAGQGGCAIAPPWRILSEVPPFNRLGGWLLAWSILGPIGHVLARKAHPGGDVVPSILLSVIVAVVALGVLGGQASIHTLVIDRYKDTPSLLVLFPFILALFQVLASLLALIPFMGRMASRT